jgi:hypothetical protein
MIEELKRKIENDFLGKYVALTQQNNFVLDGIITEISGDFIVFKTGIASSLININDVKRIVPRNRPVSGFYDNNKV